MGRPRVTITLRGLVSTGEIPFLFRWNDRSTCGLNNPEYNRRYLREAQLPCALADTITHPDGGRRSSHTPFASHTHTPTTLSTPQITWWITKTQSTRAQITLKTTRHHTTARGQPLHLAPIAKHFPHDVQYHGREIYERTRQLESLTYTELILRRGNA